jgi:hypothetical protein
MKKAIPQQSMKSDKLASQKFSSSGVCRSMTVCLLCINLPTLETCCGVCVVCVYRDFSSCGTHPVGSSPISQELFKIRLYPRTILSVRQTMFYVGAF